MWRIHTHNVCNTLQHTTTHCNTTWHTLTHKNLYTRTYRVYIFYFPIHCMYTMYVIHCNTQQHIATQCDTLWHTRISIHEHVECHKYTYTLSYAYLYSLYVLDLYNKKNGFTQLSRILLISSSCATNIFYFPELYTPRCQLSWMTTYIVRICTHVCTRLVLQQNMGLLNLHESSSPPRPVLTNIFYFPEFTQRCQLS